MSQMIYTGIIREMNFANCHIPIDIGPRVAKGYCDHSKEVEKKLFIRGDGISWTGSNSTIVDKILTIELEGEVKVGQRKIKHLRKSCEYFLKQRLFMCLRLYGTRMKSHLLISIGFILPKFIIKCCALMGPVGGLGAINSHMLMPKDFFLDGSLIIRNMFM